jgi:Domain of unknown function (DUF4760)
MTVELWNTFATFGTFVVIAATAIAALVQLRHLRSGNQINAMINLGNQFDDKQFREARYLALANIASALADEGFRNYSLANSRGNPRPAVSQELIDTGRAAVLVGNFYEELGILVKHGAIDRDLVLDRWSANVRGAWRRMAPYVAWLRKAENSEAVWENFEYLTVLAEDWFVEHSSGAYPQDVRRLTMPETYPVPPPA